jgi:hypothetical protein
MEDTHCRVRVEKTVSSSFSDKSGFKQRDALCPISFNIALEKIVRILLRIE